MYGDTPGQFAHRNFGNYAQLFGIDHAHAVGAPIGHVQLAAIGGNGHVPGALAHRNGGFDLVVAGADHADGAILAVGDIDPLSIRGHGDAVAEVAGLLSISTGAVYIAKSRVLARIRALVENSSFDTHSASML